jgi:hypothetical protein
MNIMTTEELMLINTTQCHGDTASEINEGPTIKTPM